MFSSLRARVPDKLVKNLEQNFGAVGAADYRKLNQKMNVDSADTVFEFLNHEIKRGCDESLRFAQALTTVREEDSYTALYLQNTSADIRTAQYFSDAIAGLINPRATLNNFALAGGEGVDIKAHTDSSRLGSDYKIDLLMLTGIESNGKVRTYKMDSEQVLQKLSQRSQEILAQPMFGYLSQSNVEGFRISQEMAATLKSKILHRDENGVLRVNFRYDWKQELVFNSRVTTFSKEEIKEATNQMHEVVNDLYTKGAVESFFIKRNEMLLLKNHQTMHGRDFSKEDRKRVLLGASYVLPNTEVENAKSYEFRIVELGNKVRN